MVAPAAGDIARPWYTEAHVQTQLIGWLREHGYFRTQQIGATPHIEVQPLVFRGAYDQELWIRVIGYPEHRADAAADERFGTAIYGLVRDRTKNSAVSLALALPDGFPPYTAAVAATAWLQRTMPFHIYWVAQSGTVRVEESNRG